jgi:hypothetical protein
MERGLLGVLLVVGVVVTAAVAMSENLSVPERILGVSFSLLLIGLAGMTVRVWGEPQLRELYFGFSMWTRLRTLRRFADRYHDRFGNDAWLTLFRWSYIVAILSALYLAVAPKLG